MTFLNLIIFTCVSISLVFEVGKEGMRGQTRAREGERSAREGLREGVDKAGGKGGRGASRRPPGSPWGGHIRGEGALNAGEQGLGQREGEWEAGRGRA